MNKSLKIIIPITVITVIAVVTIVLVLVLGKKKKSSGGPGPGPPGPGPPEQSYYKEPKYPILASTTNFGSDLTSCACQQDIMNENFEKMGKVGGDNNDFEPVYWAGSATPNWMQAPYNGPLNDEVLQEPRNCSVGWGGCGRCYILTTTGDKNIFGKSTPKDRKLGVVVTDNCESSNSANMEWCIPYDKKGNKIETPSSVWFEKDNKTYDLKLPQCNPSDFENGNCTNQAGYNYHFDVQIQPSKKYARKDVTIHNWGDNPIIKAVRVKCPQKVLDNLRKSCGKTGCDNFKTKYKGKDGACNAFTCNYYCSYKDDGIHSNMPFWGGCPPSCPANKGDFGTASGDYPINEYIKAWGGKGCKDGKKCCPGSSCDTDGDCKPNN